MDWFCMDSERCISILYGFISIYIDLCSFIWILTCLYSFFDVFTSLVWPTSVLQAFFSCKKSVPGFLDCVNSGNCQNCQNLGIYVFWVLSKKMRVGKSSFLVILRPPDLSRRASWWTKRWIEFWRVWTCVLASWWILISLLAVPGQYKSRHPNYKSRHPKYRSRYPKYKSKQQKYKCRQQKYKSRHPQY